MTRAQEKELIRIFRDADAEGKTIILDMLFCFVSCGEEFVQEIQAVEGDKEAIKAVVAKWRDTVKKMEDVA